MHTGGPAQYSGRADALSSEQECRRGADDAAHARHWYSARRNPLVMNLAICPRETGNAGLNVPSR